MTQIVKIYSGNKTPSTVWCHARACLWFYHHSYTVARQLLDADYENGSMTKYEPMDRVRFWMVLIFGFELDQSGCFFVETRTATQCIPSTYFLIFLVDGL